MTEWIVGAKVAKVPYEIHRSTGPFEITVAGAKKIKLSDGSEWSARTGYRWGWSIALRADRLEAWSDELAAKVDLHKRQRARAWLISKLENLPEPSWEQLNAIKTALAKTD